MWWVRAMATRVSQFEGGLLIHFLWITAKTSRSRKSSDIISTLVNIYGSKELFVREYRTLLADRILSQFHYDTQKEIRYMELLKLRFGESELHLPEVMLKDVVDSKRINTHIHSENAKAGLDQNQVDASLRIVVVVVIPQLLELMKKLIFFLHAYISPPSPHARSFLLMLWCCLRGFGRRSRRKNWNFPRRFKMP